MRRRSVRRRRSFSREAPRASSGPETKLAGETRAAPGPGERRDVARFLRLPGCGRHVSSGPTHRVCWLLQRRRQAKEKEGLK